MGIGTIIVKRIVRSPSQELHNGDDIILLNPYS
ncbi:hypothetical protein V6Z12_D10G175200 [Gossypium hirsutum]